MKLGSSAEGAARTLNKSCIAVECKFSVYSMDYFAEIVLL